MDTVALVVIFTFVIIGLFFSIYFFTRLQFERRFRLWQQIEETRWLDERERAVRDAISKSRAVLGGRFTEQMVPFLPDFRYDPTEARFIGNPIDMVVFPGLARGDPQEIVIMEIKSGRTAQLSPTERKIQQLVEEGMVRWELLHRPNSEGG